MPCGHLTRLSHNMKENALGQGGGEPGHVLQSGEPRGVGILSLEPPKSSRWKGWRRGLGRGWRAGQGWGLQLLGRGDQPSKEMGGPLIPQTLTGSGPPPEEPSGGPACPADGRDRVGDSQPAVCDPRPLPPAVVKVCI